LSLLWRSSCWLEAEGGCGVVTPKTRNLLMAVRQALIIILGAIEGYLEMERSIVPKRKR
jgi:hypothetical protein